MKKSTLIIVCGMVLALAAVVYHLSASMGGNEPELINTVIAILAGVVLIAGGFLVKQNEDKNALENAKTQQEEHSKNSGLKQTNFYKQLYEDEIRKK